MRNALVHEYEGKKREVGTPTAWTINRLKKLIKAIKKPPKALDIAVRKSHIYFCYLNSQVSEVLKQMAKNTYTHVPVLDEKEKFVGVFSESSVVAWLGLSWRERALRLQDVKIKDLLPYIKKPINDFWEFIPRDMDVYSIKEKFHTATLRKVGKTFQRLGVLFVTEHGRPDEKIIGLITAWDLYKVSKL